MIYLDIINKDLQYIIYSCLNIRDLNKLDKELKIDYEPIIKFKHNYYYKIINLIKITFNNYVFPDWKYTLSEIYNFDLFLSDYPIEIRKTSFINIQQYKNTFMIPETIKLYQALYVILKIIDYYDIKINIHRSIINLINNLPQNLNIITLIFESLRYIFDNLDISIVNFNISSIYDIIDRSNINFTQELMLNNKSFYCVKFYPMLCLQLIILNTYNEIIISDKDKIIAYILEKEKTSDKINYIDIIFKNEIIIIINNY